MSKFISFFKENFIWKVVALVIAIAMWVVAINIEDPMDNRTYTVKLQIENEKILEQYGLIILNREALEQEYIAVRVWANTRLLSTQLSSNNISVFIDMSPVAFNALDKLEQGKPVEIVVPVENPVFPTFAETITDSVTTPNKVSVVLDKLETKEYPITVVRTSDSAEGYIAMEAVANPSTVKITGARSVLAEIHSVRVDIDIYDASVDFVGYSMPTVYNDQGENITSKVTVDTTEVQISVPINKLSRIPVKNPVISGFTAEGYTITGVSTDVAYIEVVGKEDEIVSLSEIPIDNIDVTGISETKVFYRDVREYLKNTGLSVKNGTPHEVNVTVTIEKEIIKEFILPLSSFEIIGENPGAEYPESVTVRLRGIERIIDGVSPLDIGASVDLTGLEEGEHNVAVKLSLPEGVVQVGEEPYITVIIDFHEELALPKPEPTQPQPEQSEEPQEEDGEESELETEQL